MNLRNMHFSTGKKSGDGRKLLPAEPALNRLGLDELGARRAFLQGTSFDVMPLDRSRIGATNRLDEETNNRRQQQSDKEHSECAVASVVSPCADQNGEGQPDEKDFHGLYPFLLPTTPSVALRPRHWFALGLLLGLVLTADAWPAEIEPMLVLAHASDPTDAGVSDTTTDFLGAGATVRLGKRRAFEIDGALGRKAINCYTHGPCRTTWGGYVAITVYPMRWRD